MYREEQFLRYLAEVRGLAQNTRYVYNSYLQRIDRIKPIDEALAAEGIERVLGWSREEKQPPFDTNSSQARSILKSYAQFTIEAVEDGEEFDVVQQELDEPQEAPGTFFRIERDLQAAVRRQLNALEEGLKAADEGREVLTATGKMDVLATDKDGQLVVIELKAGMCPAGALEQTLGYAESLATERQKAVRAILVAADFPDRIRAAAKRVKGLELRTYSFRLDFARV